MGLPVIWVPTGKGRAIDLTPLLVVLSYWAFGFGALITAALIMAFLLKLAIMRRMEGWSWLPAVCAAALAGVIPLAFCSRYALPYSKAIIYPGLAKPSLPNFDSEESLAISDAFYAGFYDKAKLIALNADIPDDISAFYYYLASAVQDSLPDNLLKYSVKNLGTLTTIDDTSPLPIINMMNDLYFLSFP